MPTDALAGIRVVDAATLAAGPLVATALGEFGADVIKVEPPGGGDPMRRWGPLKGNVGLVWKSVSRNKRCVTLDLRQDAGVEVLHELLDRSDVLIVNSRPSTLARWSIAPADVLVRHPKLVILHVSGYGSGGPSSDRPGFGTLAEAMSGFAHITGPRDGPPTLPTFMLADGVASLTATYAVMVALYHRDLHGAAGQCIDINLIEPLARLTEASTLTFDQVGESPGRTGNRWDTSAPRNTYRTADDRYVAMSSATPSIARRAFVAIGRADLADDPAYIDPLTRIAHAGEIDDLFAKWIAERTLADVMAVFETNDVAAAPVYDAEQLLADQHLVARRTYEEWPDDELGRIRIQTPVPRLSDTPAHMQHLGPALGAHNDEVYRDLLGYDDERIAGLVAAGVV